MKKALSVIVILCIVLTAFSACAPKPEKAILGTWKGQVTVLGVSTNVEYTFNENGSGVMTTEQKDRGLSPMRQSSFLLWFTTRAAFLRFPVIPEFLSSFARIWRSPARGY